MTKPFNWPGIFESAFQHPQLRVLHWKTFKQLAPRTAGMTKAQLHKMAKAVRVYRLSDDLVWAITKLSLELEPALLMDHAMAARFPFQTTLIEWDGEVRSSSYKRAGADVFDESPVQGERPCMIVSTSGRAVKIITDLSYADPDRSLCLFPLAYWFDPERELPAEGPHQSPLVTEYRDPTSGDRIQVGGGGYMDQEEITGQVHGFSRKAHWWLTTPVIAKYPDQARAIVADERMGCYMHGPIAAMGLNLHAQRDDSRKAHQALVAGTAGNPRWFGALCFMLNQQRTVRYVQASQSPLPEGVKPREVEAHEADTLTIFLPREQVVTNLVKLAAQGPRKAVGEHEVSGFWSTSHRLGRPDCNGGKHLWPLEHTRRQICSDCGALRWWKEESKRGHGPAVTRKGRRLDYGGQDINRLVEASLTKPDHAS